MLIRVVLFVLALASTATAPYAQAQGPDRWVGLWQGTLHVGVTLRIGLQIEREAGGGYAGTLISVDQGGARIPASLTVSGNSIALSVPAIAGRFQGRLRAAGDSIDGTWTQGPGALPLVLGRVGEIAAVVRPQEPVAPLPYRSEEVRFPSAARGVELAGTLTLPATRGPHPAVVLVSGSGPQDRDETVAGHRPFLVLSDHLTRRGIAVLRFDDRGVGASGGQFDTATSLDFAEDAAGAVSWLRSHAEVDPARIGILGHSEGGLVAPIVATRSHGTAFLVLLAAPGVPGDSILLLQGELIGRASGVPDAELQASLATQARSYAVVRAGGDSTALAERLTEILESAASAIGEQERIRAGLTPAGVQAIVANLTSPWFRFFVTHDPRPVLRQVRIPVLALNGALDLQVPSRVNLEAIEAELRAGGNPDVRVVEFPGLNHLFQTAQSGSPAEYAQIEETMNPSVLETIADWIDERFGSRR
jgi:uncharacterized protein